MADDEAKKAKQAEIERKRAEVRKRMEEASKAKKAKKGFMTPERKKKLRLLLRKKAAEELKKEQERKAAERRRIIEERCGKAKNLEDANEDMLKDIVKEYYNRMYTCEGQKWDLEYEVRKRDWEISDLNAQVNDLRGKFVKPTLKKVSKYENKFAKLQKKAAEFNFRNQLKVVKKKEFTLEEEDKEKKKDENKNGHNKEREKQNHFSFNLCFLVYLKLTGKICVYLLILQTFTVNFQRKKNKHSCHTKKQTKKSTICEPAYERVKFLVCCKLEPVTSYANQKSCK
uniref:Troponin I n=1 Tax=Culex tarsalis TaxID=7177 RepID=A0A1Q3FVK4_CULTA